MHLQVNCQEINQSTRNGCQMDFLIIGFLPHKKKMNMTTEFILV